MRIKLNERLVYVRPDGQQYPLHAPPERVVMQTEGFGMPPLAYQTDTAPFQNGSTVRSFTLRPRPVQLIVQQNFCGRPQYWDGRASLLDEIRPNRVTDFNNTGKLLYYLANGEVRQLDVLPESGPGFAPSEGGWREWTFTEALRFIANNPVWYDPTVQSASFTNGSSGTFPLIFPMMFASFGAEDEIQYEGTWVAYPTIQVTGPITGLHIHNHSVNKLISLAYSLPAGYSLTIVLNGIKSVTRSDGENLLRYVTPDSDLTNFGLYPDPQAPDGVNEVHVEGSGTSVDTQVTMSWYTQYFGI